MKLTLKSIAKYERVVKLFIYKEKVVVAGANSFSL